MNSLEPGERDADNFPQWLVARSPAVPPYPRASQAQARITHSLPPYW